MSFNTGNPLGSRDILDLYDNSENIDHFANSQLDEHPDRFGVKRLTLAGLIKRSMALRNEINDFSGALTFRPEWSDVPMNVSEGVGGEGGALNLQAEALGNRTEINKITSREALRRTYQEAGYNLVEGSFEQGGVLVKANDVLLQERTSRAFSGPAGVVAAGTNPLSGSFVDRSSFMYGQASVAGLAAGLFEAGSSVLVSDRGYARFNIVAGGTPNGMDILDAGSGKVAVLVISDSVEASAVGLISNGLSQNGAMARLSEIIAANAGVNIHFSAGEYVMSSVLWSALSNFTLSFDGGVVFKLADNANTFAFRLSSCSNFSTSGVLVVDGNKANNTTGGSGAGAGNGTVAISGGSTNFNIDTIKTVNGWTNGVAIDTCNNFTVNTIEANSTARRGVTLKDCSDFTIQTIKANGSDLSNAFYAIGCVSFTVGTVMGKNAMGSNAVLFELGCNDFIVESILSSDNYSGIKFELCNRFEVGAAHSVTTSVSHGVTVNSCADWQIGQVHAWNSATSGLAILNAEATCRRGIISSISSGLNGGDGVQVYTANVNFIEDINLGDVVCVSNGGHAINVDGLGATPTLPLSGAIKASSLRVIGLAGGKFGVNAKVVTDPNRGGVEVLSGQYTTNYNTPITFSDGAVSPAVSQVIGFNQVAKTANSAPTTITRFDGWTGDSKSFYILVTDANTTFAAGAGIGGCIVFGGNQLAAKGSMWKATYIDLKWYLHKLG